MKTLLVALCALTLASSAFAQSPRIVHTISPMQSGNGGSRDFWFSIPAQQQQSGQYIQLQISSPRQTTVSVAQGGGTPKQFSLQAAKPIVISLSLGSMLSSGVVETNGIHVFSKDADINCAVMMNDPGESDGFDLIPVAKWGTDYVVAAAPSDAIKLGTLTDFPSEFTIVAAFDNTQVTITPAVNLRYTRAGGGDCHTIADSAGQPIRQTLMKGQVIQYQAACDSVAIPDVTGTLIHATEPIGVLGGSMLTNIPSDFPYGNFVCEMIPPISSWANEYYTLPFQLPPAVSQSHAPNTYLVLTTQDGQIVHRTDSLGDHIFASNQPKFSAKWQYDIGSANHWTSNAPFLLVQYINSSQYPDNTQGQGDPSMMVVEPVSNFSNNTVFQSPISVGNPFNHYANIIAPVGASIMLDGAALASKYGPIVLDGKYLGYRVSGLTTSSHTVTSDKPVGVSIYGYASDDAYSWCPVSYADSAVGPNLPAPTAVASGVCQNAQVQVTPGGAPIDLVTIDTLANMSVTIDTARLAYDMSAIDATKPATLSVTFSDTARNGVRIESQYTPEISARDTMVVFTADTGRTFAQARVNVQSISLASDTLSVTLVHGDRGFTIDTLPTSPVLVGVTSTKLSYKATNAVAYDTLIVGDPCLSLRIPLVGEALLPASVTLAGLTISPIKVVNGMIDVQTEASHRLDLFNTLGECVLSSTENNVAISALPRGIYFYRLSAGGQTNVGRIATSGD